MKNRILTKREAEKLRDEEALKILKLGGQVSYCDQGPPYELSLQILENLPSEKLIGIRTEFPYSLTGKQRTYEEAYEEVEKDIEVLKKYFEEVTLIDMSDINYISVVVHGNNWGPLDSTDGIPYEPKKEKSNERI